jgi:integrase/recombinase XerD
MLFRRHLAQCPHREEKRNYKRCGCPIWLDTRIDGRRVLKSIGTSDLNSALKLAGKWIAESGAFDFTTESEPVPEPKPSTPTIQDEPISLERAWERYISGAKNRNLSRTTIYKREQLRRQMCSFAERRRLLLLRDFNLDILEDFQAEWPEGPLTRLKKLGRLKGFFRAAVDHEWIVINPAKAMKGPDPKQRPTLPFSQAEIKNILDAINIFPDRSGKIGRPNSIRLRAFVLTLRYTGLRIGDVTRLSVDQLERNRIFLYAAKTGQAVSCVVPEFVADALEQVPRLSDRYFFWTGNSSLHTATGSWQRTLQSLFKLAGVQNGYAHRFRDTFAVELLLTGVPTEDISILLGHRNIGVTQQHYSPWVQSRQRQLEANLERAWNRDPLALLHMKPKLNQRANEGGLPN